MKRLILITAAFAFSASMAAAAISANDLVAAFQAQGYSKIEVTGGLTQFKVQATKGASKIEVVYDAATGAILKQEAKWLKGNQGGDVQMASVSDDSATEVEDDVNGDDDGPNHDLNDDNGDDSSGSGKADKHDSHEGKDQKGDKGEKEGHEKEGQDD